MPGFDEEEDDFEEAPIDVDSAAVPPAVPIGGEVDDEVWDEGDFDDEFDDDFDAEPDEDLERFENELNAKDLEKDPAAEVDSDFEADEDF